MKEKTAGILGGMGPEATVDLMQRIIRLTPAKDDIDHIHCIVDNNPKIPSRIKAIIEGAGEDPAPDLVKMAQRLEAAGADFLAIACNTAHYYYPAVAGAVDIPVIHMVKEVLDHLKTKVPDLDRVGVLASPAIEITGLYESIFTHSGIRVIYPAPDVRDTLFNVIRQVKAGNRSARVAKDYEGACAHLREKGAKLCIVACTELSALDIHPDELPLVDAAQVLAQAIVTMAKG